MFDVMSGRNGSETIATKWSDDLAEYAGYRNGLNEDQPLKAAIDWVAACVSNVALEDELHTQRCALARYYDEVIETKAELADELWQQRLLPDQKFLADLYA